ncbi:hypothetical protein [Streptomyces sp. NPDC056160]|uniref:hypothetical protein n=1 Tax=Streptomyces sp. NPDC056160 TaxID=3345731 RepID=UPI0035DD65E4
MTGNRTPVPRDMPDQQADVDEDPWETARSAGSGRTHGEPAPDEAPTTDETADERGTGRAGAPRPGTGHPPEPQTAGEGRPVEENPAPDEPTG